MPVKLTARNVLMLPAGASRKEYVDEILPKFRLRVSPSGSRTFAVQYKRHGKVQTYTIGHTPPLSLADARDAARKVLADVERGVDPQADRVQARAEKVTALTFSDVCACFIARKKPNLSAATLVEYSRIARRLSPSIRDTTATEIRRADVREFLETMAGHAPVMANRVFQFVRAVCRWAVREELIERNPCEGLERPRKERSRERTLKDEEVVLLWHALEPEPPAVAAAVKLLLLLGQRSGETLAMRWTDLQLSVATWRIPGEFRKNDRPHVVPLPPLVVRILKALRRGADLGHRVLAGVSIDNPHRWWDPIRDRAIKEGAEHFTRHDLRRTCATGCARLGASPFIVSRILGHASQPGVQVTGIYDRYDRLPEMASALNAWAAHVDSLPQGRQRRQRGRGHAAVRRAT